MSQSKFASVAYVGVLTELLARRDGITSDRFVEPNEDVEDGAENVAGTVPDDLKRDYTLLQQLGSELSALEGRMDTLKLEAGRCHTFSDLQKMLASQTGLEELESDRRKARAMLTLAETTFWEDLSRAFPVIAGKPNRGVRKGWIVAWSEANTLDDAIRRAFGRS